MGRSALVYHPDFLKHDMGAGHPESPDRLRAIFGRLHDTGLMDQLVLMEPKPAPEEWITQVHAPGYVAHLRAIAPAVGRISVDPDTALSPGSLPAAFLAVGAAVAAADAIMAGTIRHAFCAVRPPGHHAERARAMGFCLFNTVAITARYLQRRHGLGRVLIVDWDVHHGNGTQEAFYDDLSVLFFSTHQSPHYPGTGRASERGIGRGEGTTVNVPLPAGAGDVDYEEVFRKILLPAADRFRPDCVLVSAGFDAHRDDPLAAMRLTEDGYAMLTTLVGELAGRHCDGRLISCLEGGYQLDALGRSVERHVRVLLAL